MWVIEIFQSKQGEGLWTGISSVFVRTLGCPLRCRFCDTAYAQSRGSDEIGADLSPEEIAGRVFLLGQQHVVITGGEPMQQTEISQLTKILNDYDYQITIETSGIFDVHVHCDLMSISPKLRNSKPAGAGDVPRVQQHEDMRHRPDVVQQLIRRHEYQLKFVVDTPADMDEVEEYLADLQGVSPERVLLMPQAIDTETMKKKAKWISAFCEAKGFSFCPRMQIFWYGHKRRT